MTTAIRLRGYHRVDRHTGQSWEPPVVLVNVRNGDALSLRRLPARWQVVMAYLTVASALLTGVGVYWYISGTSPVGVYWYISGTSPGPASLGVAVSFLAQCLLIAALAVWMSHYILKGSPLVNGKSKSIDPEHDRAVQEVLDLCATEGAELRDYPGYVALHGSPAQKAWEIAEGVSSR